MEWKPWIGYVHGRTRGYTSSVDLFHGVQSIRVNPYLILNPIFEETLCSAHILQHGAYYNT